jgi:hypothetical protein
MPSLEKDYPVTTSQWSDATPGDFNRWLDHIANEYLWSQDDVAYAFLTTFGGVLNAQGWTYQIVATEDGTNRGNAPVLSDEAVIDIRKFAVQKALEAHAFHSSTRPEEALVEHAKLIEKYIVGTTD